MNYVWKVAYVFDIDAVTPLPGCENSDKPSFSTVRCCDVIVAGAYLNDVMPRLLAVEGREFDHEEEGWRCRRVNVCVQSAERLMKVDALPGEADE